MGPQRPALRPLALQLHTLLHLAAWCQLGVVVRIELAALFGGACASRAAGYAWAPCVTSGSGALFTDLPANALGSFVMGLLASSDVLSKHLGHVLAAEAPLAAAPRSSSLQVHTAFHVGLRTGFCGSLTTFSSWMLQVVLLAAGGPTVGARSKWVEALFAIALNAWVSMAALVTGQHVCLMVYHWWAGAGGGGAAAGAGGGSEVGRQGGRRRRRAERALCAPVASNTRLGASAQQSCWLGGSSSP
jgi:fluoride exporter